MPDFNYNPSDYSPQNGHAGVYGNPYAVNQDLYNSSPSNWKDSTAYAYQQLAKYEDNALQVALMNYQNAYNSPYQQMQRYQQAGINPFDVVGKQAQSAASASPASGGSAKSSFTQEQANKLRGASDMMSSLCQIVKGASTLQQDLQEISYRKEAFPMQLKLLESKKNYQPLIDMYNAQDAETKMYSNMYNALFNLWYMGFDPQDENLPFGAYLPGIDIDKALSHSEKYKDSLSVRSLRRNLMDYRKWEQDFLPKKVKQEMDLRKKEYEERKRHNKALENLAGAGLGSSFFGNALRLLLK